ncbi:hypothetical protein Lal_00028432, partial [Lupinus albus]
GEIILGLGTLKQVVMDNERMTLLYIFCMKKNKRGGITRFKVHLARLKEQNEKCKKVSANVQHQIKKSIYEIKSKKRKVDEEYVENNPYDEKRSPRDSFFMPRKTLGAQPICEKLINDHRSIWNDRSRHIFINLLVYYSKGTIFIKYVDVSHASKTIKFVEVILYVGPKNIVHIVIDNGVNYVVARRLLEKEFFHMF